MRFSEEVSGRTREYELSRKPGAHLAEALAGRGAAATPAEVRRLLEALLRLAEVGALVPNEQPNSGEDGPTVHNMGPSNFKDGGQK